MRSVWKYVLQTTCVSYYNSFTCRMILRQGLYRCYNFWKVFGIRYSVRATPVGGLLVTLTIALLKNEIASILGRMCSVLIVVYKSISHHLHQANFSCQCQ